MLKYNITTWNDLLNTVFQKINKARNIYQGKKGLVKAIKILKDFKKKFGKLPASNSKGIKTKYNNTYNGI